LNAEVQTQDLMIVGEANSPVRETCIGDFIIFVVRPERLAFRYIEFIRQKL